MWYTYRPPRMCIMFFASQLSLQVGGERRLVWRDVVALSAGLGRVIVFAKVQTAPAVRVRRRHRGLSGSIGTFHPSILFYATVADERCCFCCACAYITFTNTRRLRVLVHSHTRAHMTRTYTNVTFPLKLSSSSHHQQTPVSP